jgi:ketosteroid isomerase-like protein
MSNKNIELVRRVYESLDLGDLRELRPAFAADFELREAASLPEAQTLRGPDAVERWVEGFVAFFDDYSYVPREVEDLGDQVLVSAVVRARGKESGAETEMTVYNLWTVRNGKLCSCVTYLDREEALRAAELKA